MELAAKLAGFLTAHAVWCVSDGGPLIPLMGFKTPDGKRQMHRFMTDRIEQGVREGQDRLSRNLEGATRAALIYDGFVTLPMGKVDALLVDIRDHSLPSCSLLMAVPYRPASSPQGFAVHRPKFLSFAGPEPDYQALGAAFFQGVDSHDKAAPVWSRHLDESL
ncbi:hypothetical protein [Prosthecobacter sp.]|uniref:hypothetical protein n=1 Tax=Prosthecobacter sp. TaxID=1965333 RepID=UPI00378450E0